MSKPLKAEQVAERAMRSRRAHFIRRVSALIALREALDDFDISERRKLVAIYAGLMGDERLAGMIRGLQ